MALGSRREVCQLMFSVAFEVKGRGGKRVDGASGYTLTPFTRFLPPCFPNLYALAYCHSVIRLYPK